MPRPSPHEQAKNAIRKQIANLDKQVQKVRVAAGEKERALVVQRTELVRALATMDTQQSEA